MKYDIVNYLELIKNTPGIWIEMEYDEKTDIWEKDGARYMVPFSKDCIVDANTGNKLNDEDIADVCKVNNPTKFTQTKYRWMLAQKFNEYLL